MSFSARDPRGRRGSGGGELGVLSLEFALTVPLVFLVVLVVFHAAAVARDTVVVQDAARVGARVAATTTSHDAVVDAVSEALGGRWASVGVVPRDRQPGDLARVTVKIRSRFAVRHVWLRATAVATVEPGVGT